MAEKIPERTYEPVPQPPRGLSRPEAVEAAKQQLLDYLGKAPKHAEAVVLAVRALDIAQEEIQDLNKALDMYI